MKETEQIRKLMESLNEVTTSREFVSSEEEQLRMVSENPDNISRIANPTLKVMIAAVTKDPLVIQHIISPPEQVQLAAVKLKGQVIRFIRNPSEQVQLAAVKQDPMSINQMFKPTPKVLSYYKSIMGESSSRESLLYKPVTEDDESEWFNDQGIPLDDVIDIGWSDDPEEVLKTIAEHLEEYGITIEINDNTGGDFLFVKIKKL